MSKRMQFGAPVTGDLRVDPVNVDALVELKKNHAKWFNHSLRVAHYLLRRDAMKDHDYIAKDTLWNVAGVNSSYQWGAVFQLLRDILQFGFSRDIHNAWGRGYVLVHMPEQSVAEIIKSLRRAVGHMRSGHRRFSAFGALIEAQSVGNYRLLRIWDQVSNLFELTMPTMVTWVGILEKHLDELGSVDVAGTVVTTPLIESTEDVIGPMPDEVREEILRTLDLFSRKSLGPNGS